MDSWYEVEVWPKIEKVGADGSLWWATRWQRGGLVAAGARGGCHPTFAAI